MGDVVVALDGAVEAPQRAVTRAGGQGRGPTPPMPRARRAASQRRARWTLAVASVALFGVVWNLTDHKLTDRQRRVLLLVQFAELLAGDGDGAECLEWRQLL